MEQKFRTKQNKERREEIFTPDLQVVPFSPIPLRSGPTVSAILAIFRLAQNLPSKTLVWVLKVMRRVFSLVIC